MSIWDSFINNDLIIDFHFKKVMFQQHRLNSILPIDQLTEIYPYYIVHGFDDVNNTNPYTYMEDSFSLQDIFIIFFPNVIDKNQNIYEDDNLDQLLFNLDKAEPKFMKDNFNIFDREINGCSFILKSMALQKYGLYCLYNKHNIFYNFNPNNADSYIVLSKTNYENNELAKIMAPSALLKMYRIKHHGN